MKKNFLITLCLLLSLNSIAFAVDTKISPAESEMKQKNKPSFSFITFDFSSNKSEPRNTVTKSPEQEITNRKDNTTQTSIKDELMSSPTTEDADNKIHFFRLDLLGLFKIQL